MGSVRLYLRLELLQLRAAMEYRIDFLVSCVGSVLYQSVGLVFLITFFRQVPLLGGWSGWNVAVLHGMIMTGVGLSRIVAEGAWRIRVDVNQGTFDRVLVRPLSPVIQQLTSTVSVGGFVDLACGVGVLAAGLVGSGVRWHWWSIPLLVLSMLSGLVICASVNLMANLPVFWEPAAQSAFPTMVAKLRDFAMFPLTIYPIPVQVVVIAIPYSFISYFPALMIFGYGGPERFLGLGGPVIAAFCALTASRVWKLALEKYQGTGS